MFARGLAVCLTLAIASVAQAGAVFELLPSPPQNPYNPCGYYAPGEVVTVELFARQSTVGDDQYLRLVQLDFSDSDSALGLPAAITWAATDRHFALIQDEGGTAKRFSNTFRGKVPPLDPAPEDLGLDITRQLLLSGSSFTSEKVGEFDVTMPGAVGDYVLDVVNSDESHPDKGGQVRFGYSLIMTEYITVWRADTGDLTGGTFTFHIIDQALIASSPGNQKSLSRVQKNIAKLTFDTDLGAVGPVAIAGQVEVVQLLAGGALGGDLSASFSFEIANDGGGDPRVLVVKDTGANMSEAWYAIRNVGWGVVPAFEVQYRVLPGDIDGNGFVLSNDVAAVNAAFGPCPTGDCPEDIDGNNFVLSNDVAAANANFGPGPPKPDGHDCD